MEVSKVTSSALGQDFMVSTKRGFAVLEWFGGHDPDTDDVLIGNFEPHGMHDILDDTADESLWVAMRRKAFAACHCSLADFGKLRHSTNTGVERVIVHRWIRAVALFHRSS
jgi:hypothetical protein